ncbi:hypothetical protein BVX97_05750, partial [bacterium E08(2017)]
VRDLVVGQRWMMYSLFIGLTLGGAPVVWALLGKCDKKAVAGAVAGFIGMAALALAQQKGAAGAGADTGNFVMLFLAGAAGASAMILPGVSGGYLLLVLGQYVVILSAIDSLKIGLSERDMAAVLDVGLKVCLPVGVGVLAGIVGVSNLLQFLMKRYEKFVLGVLLGLLLGAVIGLWPFQEGVQPEVGDMFKGQIVTQESIADIDKEDYPTKFFKPTAGQSAGAVGIILAGFGITFLIARFGRGKDEE